MKVVFLPRAVADLGWFRQYYESVLPEGAGKARGQLTKTLETLRRHSLAGRTGEEDTREIVIGRTPFVIVYRLSESRIEILRVWDQRAERAEDWP